MMLIVAKNQHGQWQEILERTEIERACMQENQDGSHSSPWQEFPLHANQS